MPQLPPQIRTFDVRSAAGDGGTLEGIAAAFGQLDTYQTVFAPGCFESALGPFLHEGVLLAQHDSSSGAVGFPLSGEEVADGLFLRFAFHDTPRAQEYRKVCAERLASGKKVGLSIGFDIAVSESFRNGPTLLRSVGSDLARYDVATLSQTDKPCVLIRTVSRVYECSIVNFASIPQSEVTAVRSVTSPRRSIWQQLGLLNTELNQLIHLCKLDNNSLKSG